MCVRVELRVKTNKPSARRTATGQYSDASGGDAVIFGLGSYGSEADGNMGKCYRFTLDTGANDIIAQNSMFVRLGTDYEIRNGGYFESIKNSANQFISKP